MKVTILNEEFELTTAVARGILTESAFKLFSRVKRQGGELKLTTNSIKQELWTKEMNKK